MTDDPRLLYTEVDLPKVIAKKTELLERTPEGRAVLARRGLRLVGADVEKEPLSPLISEGPLVVVAEGLLMYLDPSQQRRLFEQVRALAETSGALRFVFDFVPPDEQPPPGAVGKALAGIDEALHRRADVRDPASYPRRGEERSLVGGVHGCRRLRRRERRAGVGAPLRRRAHADGGVVSERGSGGERERADVVAAARRGGRRGAAERRDPRADARAARGELVVARRAVHEEVRRRRRQVGARGQVVARDVGRGPGAAEQDVVERDVARARVVGRRRRSRPASAASSGCRTRTLAIEMA